MRQTAIDLSTPALGGDGPVKGVQNTLNKWVHIRGIVGGATITFSLSDDGAANFQTIIGNGANNPTQLPANGIVTADGDFEIPNEIPFLKATASAGAAAIAITLWCLKLEGTVPLE